MAVKKTIREVVSPMDLLMVVANLQRIFRRNEDISKFLAKIDEPEELNKLYAALETLIGFVG
jgi:hypothetical protein